MSKTLEQKLCKRSPGYSFLRNVLVRPAMYLYYRNIDVTGVELVPNSGAVIFAPNHQNALMDALAIICTKDNQPVFVARADIFKKPLLIAILNFLRILPIYRKRDGGSSSDNNQETFELILKVLDSQHSVGIMPEGVHNKVKRLQMLQKGIFRLAMQAQERYGNSPNIKIIPVGIEYTNTKKFRSALSVRYGDVIEVSDYYDHFVENPARAYKLMQDKLAEKLKAAIIHIDSEPNYVAIEQLRTLYLKRAIQKNSLSVHSAEDRFQTQKKIISVLQKYELDNPDEMSSLGCAVAEYFNIIQKHNLRDWVIERQPYTLAGIAGRGIFALLGFPFWILGMLFNYLPYKFSALSSRKVKDPQFISTVQFVAGLVLFPLYHFILIVLMVIFIPPLWGKFLAPATLLPLGLFAYRYYISMKKLGAQFRFWATQQKQEIKKAVELRKKIFEKMEEIF